MTDNRPTVDDVVRRLKDFDGGASFPPVEVTDRTRKLIANYIEMGRSTEEIVKTIVTVRKTWFQMVFKAWRKGKKP